MMIRKRFVVVAALIATLFGGQDVMGQGCVAVRPMSCASGGPGLLMEGQWQLSNSYRYFRSFRHFRGEHEEKNRVAENTEVINITHATDLGATYAFNNRSTFAINVPVIYYDRSSLYEHYGNSPTANPTHARFNTGARGLGDVRLTANYWVFNPANNFKGNLALGVGLKTPTGNSNVQDVFHRRTKDGRDSTITKAVDQSIQLGDGGWGVNLEVQGFQQLFNNASLYFNAFYMFNPKNRNDASHSVADQYAARLGLNYSAWAEKGLSFGLGSRIEGIPSEDLIGKSEGSRRPGYVISVEPSVSYATGMLNFTLNVPYALYRNRTQSVSDKQRTKDTGTWVQGDAAFADYLVNFNIGFRLGAVKHTQMDQEEKN